MGKGPPKIELLKKGQAREQDTSAPSRLPSSAMLPDQEADDGVGEAPMRMPSAVMRVDLPGESSVSLPVMAQRRAYAPPKLSQSIPGKVCMVEPGSQLVSQWLATI